MSLRLDQPIKYLKQHERVTFEPRESSDCLLFKVKQPPLLPDDNQVNSMLAEARKEAKELI